MIDYRLDSWVILRVELEEETYYKVLGGCSGGYLDGDSWRMNSGIESIEVKDNVYHFHGASGSIYEVPISREGLAVSFMYIYDQLKEMHGDKIEIVPVEEAIEALNS
jgi:hypothetical protein